MELPQQSCRVHYIAGSNTNANNNKCCRGDGLSIDRSNLSSGRSHRLQNNTRMFCPTLTQAPWLRKATAHATAPARRGSWHGTAKTLRRVCDIETARGLAVSTQTQLPNELERGLGLHKDTLTHASTLCV